MLLLLMGSAGGLVTRRLAAAWKGRRRSARAAVARTGEVASMAEAALRALVARGGRRFRQGAGPAGSLLAALGQAVVGGAPCRDAQVQEQEAAALMAEWPWVPRRWHLQRNVMLQCGDQEGMISSPRFSPGEVSRWSRPTPTRLPLEVIRLTASWRGTGAMREGADRRLVSYLILLSDTLLLSPCQFPTANVH